MQTWSDVVDKSKAMGIAKPTQKTDKVKAMLDRQKSERENQVKLGVQNVNKPPKQSTESWAMKAYSGDVRRAKGAPSTQVLFQDVAYIPGILGAGERGKTMTKEVLKDATWAVRGSEKVGLIGANGCGKSIQLLMIQGTLDPTQGEIVKKPKDMKIGYMKQEAALDQTMTVVEELLSVFASDRSLEAIDVDLERVSRMAEGVQLIDQFVEERAAVEAHRKEVDDLLPVLGLMHRRDEPISMLSGGWQMRVGLGKIMLTRPNLVLLDEPTNHVDLETVQFMETFLKMQKIPMVIVSHDRYFLNRVCTKIVEVYKGKTKSYTGNYLDFLRRRDKALAVEWTQWNAYLSKTKDLEKQLQKLEGRSILDKAREIRDMLTEAYANPPPKPEVSEFRDFFFPPAALAPGEEAPMEAEVCEVVQVDSPQVEAEDAEVVAEEREKTRQGLRDERAKLVREAAGARARGDQEPSPQPEPDFVEVVGQAAAGEEAEDEQEDEEDADNQDESDVNAEPEWGSEESESVEAVPVARRKKFGKPLLEVEHLDVSYDGRPILKNVSLQVRAGEKVAVVGRNGCGKSTMIKAIVNDLGEGGTRSGEISFSDGGLAYFPQRLAEAFNGEHTSVQDALYWCCGAKEIENAGGMEAVLARIRLDGATRKQPVSSLSGGEKARVAFAQFMLEPCAVLVLDEPTNHLDIPTRELLEDALKQYDGAVLAVSHDRFFLREFATRVIEVTPEGMLRDYDSWESYEREAPKLWKEAAAGEDAFIKQDARASMIWSDKRLQRLKKREGNVGMRRLSVRAEDKIEELKEERKPQPSFEERLVEKWQEEGVNPRLLDQYRPVEKQDKKVKIKKEKEKDTDKVAKRW